MPNTIPSIDLTVRQYLSGDVPTFRIWAHGKPAALYRKAR